MAPGGHFSTGVRGEGSGGWQSSIIGGVSMECTRRQTAGDRNATGTRLYSAVLLENSRLVENDGYLFVFFRIAVKRLTVFIDSRENI